MKTSRLIYVLDKRLDEEFYREVLLGTQLEWNNVCASSSLEFQDSNYLFGRLCVSMESMILSSSFCIQLVTMLGKKRTISSVCFLSFDLSATCTD